jgi:hypothetical protein
MRILRDAVLVLTGDDANLSDEGRQKAQQMLDRMKKEFDYCDDCVREVITMLLRTRHAD